MVGCDADPTLLAVASAGDDPVTAVAGDALRLPFPDDSFDLVVCQALLINLPDPATAVAEFARVSSDLVAAVEPDNAAVEIDSSVESEGNLERRARRAYQTASGPTSRSAPMPATPSRRPISRWSRPASTITSERSNRRTARALEAARRKATGAGLADDRETMLEGELTETEYDDLRSAWRTMGRDVIDQMGHGSTSARRRSVFVTVGRVRSTDRTSWVDGSTSTPNDV